jgi:ribosomal protein S18 acetylase RimI-like enzyme
MNEILVRRVTVNDVATLSTLAKNTFYDSFSGTCTTADMEDFLEKYYSKKSLEAEIADDEMKYFFAEYNGEPVGYILFKQVSSDFAELKNSKAIELKRLYVSSHFHGKGVAQKLMDFFLDFSKKEGFEKAFLGVWEYNSRARYFYTKYGFLTTSNRHDFPIGNTTQIDVYLVKDLV